MAQLAGLVTITTIMISRGVRGFFVLKVFFYWPVVTGAVSIALLVYGDELTGHFNLSIDVSFNDLLLVFEVLIFFIKLGPYKWSEAIPEITNE